MSEVLLYHETYRPAWEKYVATSDSATVAHQIEWHQIMHRGLGHEPRYLLSWTGVAVDGLLPLFLVKTWWGKKYLISLPWIDYGGLLADSPAIARQLLESAKQIAADEKVDFIELRSIDSDNLDLAQRTDKVTFCLALDEDYEKIWKGFDAKLRNQIRKSGKSGLKTEFASLDRLDDFYKVFGRNMRDLGTPVWGRDFFQEILTSLGDRAKLILVRKDDLVIAAGLVLSFKDTLYVPSASAYRSWLKSCPNHALYWSVIRQGCQDGYRQFDFGRSSHNSNTFRFKKQWVPEPTQLTWQYHLAEGVPVPKINPDNPKFGLMIKIWQHLPLPIANWLGPKVIRNFP